MTDEHALEVAVKSASYNIVLQILMRILSSLCNAVVLRFISKDSLGVVNVRLMLLYSTCHFFSREAFRRSGLSKSNVCYDFLQKCNLLWLCVPTCLICSSVLGYVWLYWLENPSPDLVPNYSLGVLIVLVSVFIEIIAEPVHVFSRIYHFVKLKVLIEGLSLTLKSVSMVIFLWLWPGNAIYAFCVSQLGAQLKMLTTKHEVMILSSLTYTFAFYGYFWWYFKNSDKVMTKLPIHSLKGLLPRLPYFFVDKEDLRLTWSFFKQTLLKQLLTEGERYIMTFFSVMSFAEQGLYDVVSNLGSLSARFIFLPIEDSGYLLFTQLLPRDKRLISLENLSQSLHILQNLLKLLILLGLTILTFGYSYSKLLLLLYGGSGLSSSIAVTLLRWHCVYVLLLAVNGITECFKFAVMSQQQLDAYNKNMVFLSIGFLFAAFVFAKTFGAVGFIMANCFNMGLRIAHSICFIDEYFSIHYFYFIRKLIPHSLVLTILVSSLGITSISEACFCCDQGFKAWMWHLGIGMCCFFAFIVSVFLKEKAALKFIYDRWSGRASSLKKIS